MVKLGITKDTDPLTTAQVTYLLGLSKDAKRVNVFIRKGRLTSSKPGRDRFVSREDFLAFASKPRPVPTRQRRRRGRLAQPF